MSGPASLISLFPLSLSAPPAPSTSKSSRRTTARPERSEKKTPPPEPIALPPLIAFCHLSWSGVWQRPQQFLSRLALRRNVLFVETYRSEIDRSFTRARTLEKFPTITVLEVHLPAREWHNGPFIDRERRRLVRGFQHEQADGRFDRPVLWFNDPMAVTAFAGHLDEQAVVYDCMDELSQFVGAPPGIVERERQLLQHADVVFCGGRKMRDKRLPVNPNVHFYGTGVDCAHFAMVQTDGQSPAVDPAMAQLKGPILGFFGVIDERLDYELIGKLAKARSDWHVVMVGPTAKVDPSRFPRSPNLHWIGPRDYAVLPAITRKFTVCLMPFALNASTEYINPTKALEYMAAGKPVVSTELDEVRTNFSSACFVADTHEKFIVFCASQVAAPSAEKISEGFKLCAAQSWETITGRMEQHIADAIASRRRPESNKLAETFREGR